MSPRNRPGPSLDEQAHALILDEEANHKRRLLEIERDEPSRWAELLPAESDRHLGALTRIYAELAMRRLEQRERPKVVKKVKRRKL